MTDSTIDHARPNRIEIDALEAEPLKKSGDPFIVSEMGIDLSDQMPSAFFSFLDELRYARRFPTRRFVWAVRYDSVKKEKMLGTTFGVAEVRG